MEGIPELGVEDGLHVNLISGRRPGRGRIGLELELAGERGKEAGDGVGDRVAGHRHSGARGLDDRVCTHFEMDDGGVEAGAVDAEIQLVVVDTLRQPPRAGRGEIALTQIGKRRRTAAGAEDEKHGKASNARAWSDPLSHACHYIAIWGGHQAGAIDIDYSHAMETYEKLGVFYLGRGYDPGAGRTSSDLLLYDARDLTTHAVILGMTGSGKTGLGMALIEEAALDGIPTLVIDPKGDMGNLLLAFPELAASDFAPWIDPAAAARAGRSPAEEAASEARRWAEGLAAWGESRERIARFRAAAEPAIYTPGSTAGLPLSMLRSFASPSPSVLADQDARSERIEAATSGLLALLGIDADPLASREHILIASLLDHAWKEGKNVDLAGLVREIQKPPLATLGALDVETYYPARERAELAGRLNGLLAAPGAGAWFQGEPLDAGRLLWTKEGRPRIAVITLAHLADRERMFAVTLILNEVLTWMRSQPGTSSLRALLYFDETFGYLPPTANPPAKKPFLTLFKQARAFGLGVVAATQNPVDLDYKALSNAGTWFLGRLSTERDKARVLDGLTAVDAGAQLDRATIDRTLSSLKSRIFLMQNVHEDGPIAFETRWVLSYLRGPLTRDEIRRLMAERREQAATDAPASPHTRTTTAASTRETRPALPSGVQELFLTPPDGAGALVYRPFVLGEAQLHYVTARPPIDHWEKAALAAPLDPEPGADPELWESAADLAPTDATLITSEAVAGAAFAPLPAGARDAKRYATWGRALANHLYRARTLTLWRAPALGAVSAPGESEGAFRARLLHLARESRDEAMAKVRARYALRLERLRARLDRAEERIAREEAQYESQKTQTAISLGATLAGALFGRKLGSATGVGRATTAARGLGRAAKEREERDRATEKRQVVEAELKALEAELETELGKLANGPNPTELALEPIAIRPRKADIAVGRVALLWAVSRPAP